MSAKHTPGPWVALYDSGTTDQLGQGHREATFAERFIVASGMRSGSPCIADCGYGRAGRDDSETLANARLIAAAPDLLAALRDAENMIRMMQGNPHWESIAQDVQKRCRTAIAKAGVSS